MPTRFRIHALALLAAGLAACGDSQDPSQASPTVPEPAFAPVSAVCSTQQLASLARSYFSNPEQKTVSETLRAMETNCAGGFTTPAAAGGWSVLSTIESVLEAGTGGSAADGAALANGVMDYMCGLGTQLCAAPNGRGDLVSAADLGSQGIFAVRSGGTDHPAVARGKVPFTAFGSGPNAALWGIDTKSTWKAATTVDMILFYGSPTSPYGVDLAETPFGSLGYQLHTFPDVPTFADQQLIVGACYDTEVALPHENDNPSLPTLGERMQREGTLLNPLLPDCGSWSTQTASVATGLLSRMARFVDWALAPSPLLAAVFGDRGAPAVGGTPLDFSNFAPVAARRTGYLQFKVPPGGDFPNGTSGVAFDDIQVQAFSGNGTPMELVRVELYVAGNEGEPAGATFCDPDLPGSDDPSCSVFDTDANGEFIYTQEQPDGNDPYAVFQGVTLYKAGGFRICARADETYYTDGNGLTQVDFTFTEACSQLFNMKNR